MGQESINIVVKSGVRIKILLEELNKAYCDEWLAYIQYLEGAQVASGMPRQSLVAELEEHAAEELKHAQKLAKRILELGGTPIIEPKMWYKYSNCGYEAPIDHDAVTILEQSLRSERCAIIIYNKLIKRLDGRDPVTHKILVKILEEEIEHEQELEDIQNDIATLFSARKKK